MLITAVAVWVTEKESALMREYLMFSSQALICI